MYETVAVPSEYCWRNSKIKLLLRHL